MTAWGHVVLLAPAYACACAHALPACWTGAERARFLHAVLALQAQQAQAHDVGWAYVYRRSGAWVMHQVQRMTRHPPKALIALIAAMGLFMLGLLVVTPLPLTAQGVLGLSFIVAVSVIDPLHAASPRSQRLLSLAIVVFTLTATLRYAWWRINNTLVLDPWPTGVASLLMMLSEAYFWVLLLLGNFLALWRLPRRTEPLHAPEAEWPHVDVYIPTYNESLAVVQPTVLAALDMDWPADKLHVWLLDDGKRDAFEAFAREAGCGYIRRRHNPHAKAGNINHALGVTQGQYIAIFDCDHIPARHFLKRTVGLLENDPRCALVQTPHHFFSMDPVERNLALPVSVPNEGRLFYGLLQPGNDLWNATMFCGSCAVLRRTALEEVGGIATETVTEDAHTSLRLTQRGHVTAYLNEPLAAGLATETLQGHVGQRIRWGRGMVQILRLSNPTQVDGLRWYQRLSYLNACLYFLHGVPRLMLLISPLLYLTLGKLIDASAAEWLTYLLPHMIVSRINEHKIQGKERALCWGELYEVLLCWPLLRPTWVALFNPKEGKFNVTDKGHTLSQDFFDWTNGRIYLLLSLVNLIPLLDALSLVDDPISNESLSGIVNGVWALYNLGLVGAALHVACERRQIRQAARVSVLGDVDASVIHQGRRWRAYLRDFSTLGLGVQLHRVPTGLQVGDELVVVLRDGARPCAFKARVQRLQHDALGLQLLAMDLRRQTRLLRCTFSRPGLWREQLHRASRQHRHDLMLLLQFSGKGYLRLWQMQWRHLRVAWRGLQQRWRSA